MIAAPALEVLKRQSALLTMPLFAAAFYVSFGSVFESELPSRESWYYELIFAVAFITQVVVISAVVLFVEVAIISASLWAHWLRPTVGLTALTVGFIPLAGLANGEIGNLLWPIAMLTFGFRIFQDN